MTEKKQGIGKHGHKDTQEPHEHRGEHQKGGEEGQQASSRQQEKGGSEKESMKAREYRDEQGETHHHTKEYMERHGDKSRDR